MNVPTLAKPFRAFLIGFETEPVRVTIFVVLDILEGTQMRMFQTSSEAKRLTLINA